MMPPESPKATAWLNGQFLPFDATRLPVWDRAIVQGATVTDMVRTFNGEPFLLNEHLARFSRSCTAVGIDLPESEEQISQIVRGLLDRNRPVLSPQEEIGLVFFATPGDAPMYASALTWGEELITNQPPSTTNRVPTIKHRPTLCVHPFRLPIETYARGYRAGISLAVPTIRQVPPSILSPQIKFRSRLHWWLADREVQAIDSAAVALLLDAQGYVTETASGNLFVVRKGEFFTPRFSMTLEGVSRRFVMNLLASQGRQCHEADLTPDDVATADEVFVTSTTYCLLPVTRFQTRPIANGQPGSESQRLLTAWFEHVGCPFPSGVGQAPA